MKIILASSSPRRHEILLKCGIPHTVAASDVDESISSAVSPDKMVSVLAERKAKYISESADQETIVIGSDTVVCLKNEILGKPHDEESARAMLEKLSGKQHTVYTGICVTNHFITVTETLSTKVFMRRISGTEIDRYILSGEPMDKAGAYGIQGIAGKFIEKIDGDYYTVVGLPVCRLTEILHDKFGLEF
jgi:septum formation protein